MISSLRNLQDVFDDFAADSLFDRAGSGPAKQLLALQYGAVEIYEHGLPARHGEFTSARATGAPGSRQARSTCRTNQLCRHFRKQEERHRADEKHYSEDFHATALLSSMCNLVPGLQRSPSVPRSRMTFSDPQEHFATKGSDVA